MFLLEIYTKVNSNLFFFNIKSLLFSNPTYIFDLNDIVVRFWFVLAQKLPPYQNNRFGENMAQIGHPS